MEKRSLEYLLRHLLLVRELEPDSEVRPWAEVVAHIGRCGAQLLDDHARKHPTIFPVKRSRENSDVCNA